MAWSPVASGGDSKCSATAARSDESTLLSAPCQGLHLPPSCGRRAMGFRLMLGGGMAGPTSAAAFGSAVAAPSAVASGGSAPMAV